MLLGILLFCCCDNKHMVPSVIDEENSLIVKISANNKISANSNAETKVQEIGESNKNENFIDYTTLQIWFFDEQTGSLIWKPSIDDYNVNSSDQKIVFSAFKERSNCIGKKVTIVVIANLPLGDVPSGITTISELNSIVTSANFNTSTINSFVMRGSASKQFISSDSPGSVSIPLSRLASKIRAMMPIISNKLIVDGDIKVKLLHYVNKGYVDSVGYYSNTLDNPLLQSEYITIPSNSSTIYYSYQRDYSIGSFERVSLIYEVPLQLGDGSVKKYYYKLDVSGTELQNPIGFNYLRSNTLYEVRPIINGYGAESDSQADGMASISAEISILNWTTKELQLKIQDIHYLVVKETMIVMPNTSSYSIPFESDLPVTIDVNTDVISSTISYDNIETGNISGTANIYTWNLKSVVEDTKPSVTINNSENLIVVNSPVPSNYVPRTITITIHSGILKETITIIQYPIVYMEGVKSSRHPSLSGSFINYNAYVYSSSQNNATIYTVSAITAAEAYSGSLSVRIGNASGYDHQGNVYTRSDYESNRLVSPKFVVASQIGIHYSNNYNYALERCKQYSEYNYGPGTWRIPTTAELQLIGKLQTDPSSAVKNLLVGNRYWSAEKSAYYGYYKTVTLSTQQAYDEWYLNFHPVRCIHDIY